MDLTRQLKIAMGSGNMLFGQKQTVNACAKGDARLIILAANCPQTWIDDIHARHPDVAMHRVMLVNRELGIACAKPFSISTICITDAGNSELLTLRNNIE